MVVQAYSTHIPFACPECHRTLDLDVQKSAAGWYLGTWCACGPYSRHSEYFTSQAAAERALIQQGLR